MTDRPESPRRRRYREIMDRIISLLDDEDDWVAAMATVSCELHRTFDHFHWTGFYRVIAPELMAVGPYQGGHGCLRIPFSKGICGAAARSQKTQRVDDVRRRTDHIACSATTRSELVLPLVSPQGELFAVLDIDSDDLAAFNDVDQQCLEELAHWLATRYGHAVNMS